jgi:plasmid maintenance system antidote protein VapI
LRAFARDLEISPASLSNILAGKQSISKRLAESISTAIFLPGSSKELFMLSAEYASTRSVSARKVLKQQISVMMRDEKSQMDLEAFAVIQDPIHFAVLESLKLPKLNGNLEMISNFLEENI